MWKPLHQYGELSKKNPPEISTANLTSSTAGMKFPNLSSVMTNLKLRDINIDFYPNGHHYGLFTRRDNLVGICRLFSQLSSVVNGAF